MNPSALFVRRPIGTILLYLGGVFAAYLVLAGAVMGGIYLVKHWRAGWNTLFAAKDRMFSTFGHYSLALDQESSLGLAGMAAFGTGTLAMKPFQARNRREQTSLLVEGAAATMAGAPAPTTADIDGADLAAIVPQGSMPAEVDKTRTRLLNNLPEFLRQA